MKPYGFRRHDEDNWTKGRRLRSKNRCYQTEVNIHRCVLTSVTVLLA